MKRLRKGDEEGVKYHGCETGTGKECSFGEEKKVRAETTGDFKMRTGVNGCS